MKSNRVLSTMYILSLFSSELTSTVCTSSVLKDIPFPLFQQLVELSLWVLNSTLDSRNF